METVSKTPEPTHAVQAATSADASSCSALFCCLHRAVGCDMKGPIGDGHDESCCGAQRDGEIEADKVWPPGEARR